MVKLKINFIWMIYILVHLLSAYIYPKSYAQRSDTLVVSLKEAEEKFLKENLQLIASKYNISAAECADYTGKIVEQSKPINRTEYL